MMLYPQYPKNTPTCRVLWKQLKQESEVMNKIGNQRQTRIASNPQTLEMKKLGMNNILLSSFFIGWRFSPVSHSDV